MRPAALCSSNETTRAYMTAVSNVFSKEVAACASGLPKYVSVWIGTTERLAP
jgi:hypothetical protein